MSLKYLVYSFNILYNIYLTKYLYIICSIIINVFIICVKYAKISKMNISFDLERINLHN